MATHEEYNGQVAYGKQKSEDMIWSSFPCAFNCHLERRQTEKARDRNAEHP